MNKTNKLVAHLTLALELWRAKSDPLARKRAYLAVQSHHAALLKALRDENAPTPEWDRFPIARDFFTQTQTA